MKIGQTPPEHQVGTSPPASSAPAAATTKALQQQTAAATAQASATSAGVAVSVSARARSLEQVSSPNGSDVDQAKVDAVRAAIEQGTYQVNPEAIADKLLANAQEMFNRTQN
jgi:negative regulator of flagellin synthesis FlgM